MLPSRRSVRAGLRENRHVDPSLSECVLRPDSKPHVFHAKESRMIPVRDLRTMVAALVLVIGACSSNTSNQGTGGTGPGAGGSAGTGGTTAAGGATGSGGLNSSAGQQATGNAIASGGRTGAGGTIAPAAGPARPVSRVMEACPVRAVSRVAAAQPTPVVQAPLAEPRTQAVSQVQAGSAPRGRRGERRRHVHRRRWNWHGGQRSRWHDQHRGLDRRVSQAAGPSLLLRVTIRQRHQ